MKVNIAIELSEDQLRRVRAGAYKRGGRATRSEVRMWVTLLVGRALQAGPDPITRRKATPKSEPRPEPEPDVEVTDETPCRHCQRQRQSHGKMMGTCLPGFGAAPGSRFSPARG